MTYRVETIENCSVIYGPMPMRDAASLMSGASPSAVMDVSLADYSGATLVIGDPNDLKRLRDSRLLPPSPEREAQANAARCAGVKESVALWLLDGERGASSNAMCQAIYGTPNHIHLTSNKSNSVPYDADDFARCVHFINMTDSAESLHLAAQISPHWNAIIHRWSELATDLTCGKNKIFMCKKGNDVTTLLKQIALPFQTV